MKKGHAFSVGQRVQRNPKIWGDKKADRWMNHGVIVALGVGRDNNGREKLSYLFRTDGDTATLLDPKADKDDVRLARNPSTYLESELIPEK